MSHLYSTHVRAALTTLATLSLLLLGAPAALACGGFFCSQTQPVNQAAERIIFVDHPDGTVTAVVQILYDGPSDQFSWLLPVPGEPTVGVSSNIAFQRLQQATNPFYQLTTVIEGECNTDFRSTGSGDTGGAFGADATQTPDVNVLASGSVGPYNYQLLGVEPGTTDPAQAALDWLDDEGYDVTNTGPDLLRPYLEEGMNLLAFRLQKGVSAGSIRPVTLHYTTDLPMIPIKLTAVAANADMGVLVWVVHEYRAVPSNYRSLVLNEAAINWLNPNSNYNDVVVLAANEAGGQGFVTEYAAPSASVEQVIWSDFEAENFEINFARGEWGETLSLIEAAFGTYSGFDGLEETALALSLIPDDVTPADLIACVSCYLDESDLAEVDPTEFVAALRTNVIAPLEATEALLGERPYVTRLYTTLSASEMTLDPCFDFNPDLPDVSNVHTATRVLQCRPSINQSDAPWRVELPQGGVVVGEGSTWPFTVGVDMPANLEVRQVGVRGEGEVITDNTATITQALQTQQARVNVPAGDEAGCAGCTTAGADAAADAPWLLALLGLLVPRRRRHVREMTPATG